MTKLEELKAAVASADAVIAVFEAARDTIEAEYNDSAARKAAWAAFAAYCDEQKKINGETE
jgi:hypothetical protein